jgi:ATP-dependent RNA helicase DDX27
MSSSSGVKRKSKGSKKDSSKSRGLFSGDGTGKPTSSGGAASKAGARSMGGKGAKFTGKRVDSGGMVKSISKTELNRLKRGGKGKASFKSKSRFKRK